MQFVFVVLTSRASPKEDVSVLSTAGKEEKTTLSEVIISHKRVVQIQIKLEIEVSNTKIKFHH